MITDEIGFIPMNEEAANFIFQLINERYENPPQ
ncbi:hypothetical protein J2P90_08000 [Weissella cibaria]|nr:hypothetical protein [Weissella cibaria]